MVLEKYLQTLSRKMKCNYMDDTPPPVSFRIHLIPLAVLCYVETIHVKQSVIRIDAFLLNFDLDV